MITFNGLLKLARILKRQGVDRDTRRLYLLRLKDRDIVYYNKAIY